ncbi:histidine phosphatase family protein [Kribbella antibiotica]|uniref:Histidine phosphatase family protein n=1 Tax=Kribbella antibiotica TaxID=190195 RepID=A0A4R4YPW8_9ACTN|nr:histidine phosphatase family protein [Kribbella antibiotica]TDD47176.1 histidine phosphatase family protein [Kribbella antibiotica]
MPTYLARHGQTEWNQAGRRQGRLDSPLTALGVEQAQRNAELLRTEAITAIYSSPLGRAHRTADIIGDLLGLPTQVLPDLAELDHGDWSGLTSAEIDAGWPDERAARALSKYTYPFPGGESYADADVRIAQVLASIDVQGALIVSHEMVGRLLVRRLAGLEVDEAMRRGHPSDVVFRVVGDGQIERLGSPG